jgi:hypothetical protein
MYDARATLVLPDTSPFPPAEYRAHARALPKFIAGIAFTDARPYATRRPATVVTKRIERPVLTPPGGTPGGTEAFDTVVTVRRDSVEGAGGSASSNAMIGVAFAPFASRYFGWLSVLAGVNPTRPADDWYAGLSAVRVAGAVFRRETEHFPLDLYVGGDWGRVTELEDEAACRAAGDCRTKNPRRFRGWSAMLSLDASGLISDAVKKLAGL